MKELMKQRENVSDVKRCLENLNTLCENATTKHNELLPLLPEDELIKQKEWFSSIMNYSNTFQKDIQKWMVELDKKSLRSNRIHQKFHYTKWTNQVKLGMTLIQVFQIL